MTRTTTDVLEEFRLRGISVAEWARHNGFNPTLVYQVLRSRHVPTRGQSHRIAVALGMKRGFLEQDLSLMNQVAQ
ncbi:DNA-binding protein [Chitiniphilus purpureus]|uniref:DNA-binding protein n=1 Tax=Chitiniphilus purpureus TaxID=2981137 RepID=A0ABY6DS63_9NEIS|nr:DNA-binding protein [Chitiniphilus sp. CD1]UXY17202.1 DNA-binding protein [Chitiniphilus sp. CD1]